MINSNNVFIQRILIEFRTIIRLINIKSPNKFPRLIYYVISVISRTFLFLIIIIYIYKTSLNFTKSNEFNFFKKLIFPHSIILIIYKDNHKFHRTRAFESSGVGDSGETGPECKGLKILFVSKHKHIHHRIVLLHLSIILSSLKKKKKNYKSLFPIST